MEQIVDGIRFTNLVVGKEKEAAIKSAYVPNKGKPYSLKKALVTGATFLDRNKEAIRGALLLLQKK